MSKKTTHGGVLFLSAANAALTVAIVGTTISLHNPYRNTYYGIMTSVLGALAAASVYLIYHHRAGTNARYIKILYMSIYSNLIGVLFSISVWFGRYEIPDGRNMSDIANMGMIITLIPSTIVPLVLWTMMNAKVEQPP
jgi:hypothetical protein